MKKHRKGLISLLVALVLSLCSFSVFPVAAQNSLETESVHNHDECLHEHTTEIVSEGGTSQVGVTNILCLLGHDYKFNRQWRDGILTYGSDSNYCYIIKERWIVEDKCTRCNATRELVAPGAILQYRAHTFPETFPLYNEEGEIIMWFLGPCTYCGKAPY